MDITELIIKGKIPFTALSDIKKGDKVILDLETCELNLAEPGREIKRNVKIIEEERDGIL